MEIFKRTVLRTLLLFLIGFPIAQGAETPLDRGLRPESSDEIPNVFRDMGVVQRRAMAKGGRFLLSTFGSFDFSDGPFSNYAMNVNPGYAINDFWEIYVSFVPVYFTSPRSIVSYVEQFELVGNKRITLVPSKPLRHIGGELLWAPAYGKDSLGVRNVIRSDTFFKASFAKVTFEGDTGWRYAVGVGKTYFMSKNFGVRVCVNFGRFQDIINEVKEFRTVTLLETGLMVYL
ncbi:MAG: hypothetical protein NDJ89_18430 [Oligoflexia bacterium]|nr:hypothetical protein [Oligoflexia bacterium]